MGDGSVCKVEDITVGSVVMGGDGTPRTVTALHHGFDDMYEIIPVKGRPFIVNSGHILSLISTNKGARWNCHITGNEIENISVSAYLGKPETYKHLYKLYRGKVESFGNGTELPMPPYVLGVILGDGTITKNSLSITTPDVEIYPEMIRYAKSIGCIIRLDCNSSDCPTLIFRGKDKFTKGKAVYNRILEALDIKGSKASEKFIPFAYKTASWKDRLDILAGLLDTDGNLTHGNYDYISKSKQLAEDVAFIARSVGLAAYVHECEKRCQTGGGGLYHRVCISGDTDIIPCRVKRKQAAPREQKKRTNVTGFRVEHAGYGEYFGFECDGDHLYMLDDFTVTHNSGKSHVIAALMARTIDRDLAARVLMVTHQKELIEQDYEKLVKMMPEADVGIYSASVGRKELGHSITFAGIQSLIKARDIPACTLMVVDECHLINNNETGSYRKLEKILRRKNPAMRIVGFTATPYRLGQGMITDPPSIFTDLIRGRNMHWLQQNGYLARFATYSSKLQYDTSGVRKQNGEFSEKDLAERVIHFDGNDAICDEIVAAADGGLSVRKHILVFCTGIAHARLIAGMLNDRGMVTEVLTGDASKRERERIIDDFRSGRVRALANVGVLTTGFDYPDTDMIVMLRPTMSPGLWVQAVGRGIRLKSDGGDCLVLDFAGNTLRHGAPDSILPPRRPGEGVGHLPNKTCPSCGLVVHAKALTCPSCGHAFEMRTNMMLIAGLDLNGEGPDIWALVRGWKWCVGHKGQKDEMLVVNYETRGGGAPPFAEFYTLNSPYPKYRADAVRKITRLLRWLQQHGRLSEAQVKAFLEAPVDCQRLCRTLSAIQAPDGLLGNRTTSPTTGRTFFEVTEWIEDTSIGSMAGGLPTRPATGGKIRLSDYAGRIGKDG